MKLRIKLKNLNIKCLGIFTLCFLSFSLNSKAALQVAETFQVGQSISRHSLYDFQVNTLPASYKRIAYSVGRLGRGSGILINHKDQFYFLTAAHVLLERISNLDFDQIKISILNPVAPCLVYPTESDSPRREIHLRVLNVYLKCHKMVYLNLEYDLAIVKLEETDLNLNLGIDLNQTQEFSVGERLAFFSSLTDGTPGPKGEIDINYSSDEDCLSYGSSSEFLLSYEESIIDQTEISTVAIPVACDMYPGDSGGPVIDYENGSLLGLVSARPRQSLVSTENLQVELLVLDVDSRKDYIRSYLPRVSPIYNILNEIKANLN